MMAERPTNPRIDAAAAAAMAENRASTRLPDSSRDDGREPQRTPVVRARRPRDRRFEIPEYMRRRGLDYFWAAETVLNQKNPLLVEYARSGWKLARAKDYPDLVGSDEDIDQELLAMGQQHRMGPDDPIRDSGMILVVRDQSLSQRSRDNDLFEARRQINDKMSVMREVSQRAIGQRTQLERRWQVGTGSVPSELLPEPSATL